MGTRQPRGVTGARLVYLSFTQLPQDFSARRRSSTSSTTLRAYPASHRGAGSVHPSLRPSGQSKAASTQSFAGEETVPATPAFTVAVETLAPDFEAEEVDPQSDAPTTSTEPKQPFETPSPTVSSFAHYSEDAQAVEISDHPAPSRAASTARQTIRSTFTALKNLSKASIRAPSHVSKRTLSHIRHSRKSSKAPSATNDVAFQDNDTYFADPDPFRSSSVPSDSEPLAPQPEHFSESGATFTEEPQEFAEEQARDPYSASVPSSKASSTIGIRRLSLRNSISKVGASLRQSSRVSFKALSRISSSGRSQSVASHQEPESVTPVPGSTRPPSAVDPVFPAPPEFLPPRTRSRASSSHNQNPPSLAHVSQPTDSVPGVVSPHDLTASPTVYPSEFGSPAATTLPPPSRPQSWLFGSRFFVANPNPPETDPGLSPPSAPRSPPRDLDPEVAEHVEEQPEPSRAPTTKSSIKSLFRRASSSHVPADPPVEEQPESSRAPTAKASFKSLHTRASSSQVTAHPPATHQEESAASTVYRQPTAAPSTHTAYRQPSAVPSVQTAYRQPSAAPSTHTAYRQPSAAPSTHTAYRQPSAPPSTFRQPSAPPSTRHQPSAPSAAPSYRTEKSASPTTPAPAPSAARSRAPSATARSSESKLFPRDSPFGESQPLAQSSHPPTRLPSRVPSQNPVHVPSTLPTPSPSVQSTRSRRTAPTKAHSRAASRLAWRRTSRAVTPLPTIISSRASKSNLTADPAAPEATEKVPSSVTGSPPVSPIAITITVPPSSLGSSPSSPASSRATSRKSRSRSGSRLASGKPSLLSLSRLPISSLGSRRESRASKSSRQPSQNPSQASFKTHSSATHQPPSPSQPPSPPAQPPSEEHAPSHKPSFISRLTSSRKSSKSHITQPPAPSRQPSNSHISQPSTPFPKPSSFPISHSSPPSRKPSGSHIFQPSRRPSRHFAPHELTTLPEHLVAPDGEPLEIPPEFLARMPFNEDESFIDAGMEQDYENYNWFANRPPKPEPKAPETVSPPYVPMPGVVEQNEAFIYALQAAPNVLYANYKQYGQLGVLGWCAEFSELIDHIKTLGFEGNMFVNTRTQALATCQELLKLRLDIKMQIIIMYLSSQVARLRRFLDGEGQYDDYPEPKFPLEMPRNYGES